MAALRVFFLFIILSLPALAYSQYIQEWKQSIKYQGLDYGVASKNGSYYTVVTSSPLPEYIQKINANGTLGWQYPWDGEQYFTDDYGFLYLTNNDSLFKLDSNDGHLLMAFSTSPIPSWGSAINIDHQGNIYLASNGNVTKYDSAGLLLWSTSYSSSAYTITPLDANNQTIIYSMYGDVSIIDSLGNIALQTNLLSNDRLHKIITDNQGNIITAELDTSPRARSYVFHFDSQGNFQWVDSTSNNDPGFINDLEVDSMQNIYVSGTFYDTALLPYTYVQKLSSSGVTLWDHTLTSNDNYYGFDGLLDNNGNFFLAATRDGAIPGSSEWYLTGFDAGGNFIGQFTKAQQLEDLKLWSDYEGKFYLRGLGHNTNTDSTFLYKICTDSCTPTISGKLYHDANQNCVQDSGETNVSGKIVELVPGLYDITDSIGVYQFYQPWGTYTVKHMVTNNWTATCPANGERTIVLDSITPAAINQDFGLYLDPAAQDIYISISDVPVRPGFQQISSIVYGNKANTLSGYVELTLDSIFQYQSSSPVPDNITGNTLRWDFTALQPSESRSISLTTYVDATVALGRTFTNTVIIEPTVGDDNPVDNFDLWIDTVRGSFDPNDKSVTPNRDLYIDEDRLSYMIRFQNTGTDTAFTVIVRDTIDPSLDITSIVMGAASHAYTWDIIGSNVIQWTFSNILLPDSNTNEPASHGFIKFRIKTKDNVAIGTTISNMAAIYFDFNSPVLTNRVSNVKTNLTGINETSIDTAAVNIYPNPFTTSFRIWFDGMDNGEYDVELLDLSGKILYSKHLTGTTEINPGNISNGIYFVRVQTDNGTYTGKLVKMD